MPVSFFFDTINKSQSLKKIKDPDDEESFVLIPVTDQITFRDPKDAAQEVVVRWDLTEDGGRVFHVRRVKRKTGTPEEYEESEDEFIEVERPDVVGILDPKSNAQGKAIRLNNLDEDGSWPALPGVLRDFNLEAVRHVVRYTEDNTLEGEPWVDVELIDLFPVKDPKTDGQEYIYRIAYAEKGPPIDDPDDPYLPTFAIADRELPRAEGDSEIIDPPYRTSPFENIVNVGFASAVQFETDILDPHGDPGPTGIGLADAAILHQVTCAIIDPTKMTYSFFFNIPKDPGIGSVSFIEFGGAPGITLQTSFIGIVPSEGDGPSIVARFIGPVKIIDWVPAGDNYYGLIDWSSPKAAVSSIVEGRIRLASAKPEWAASLDTFWDKWHWVGISIDGTGIIDDPEVEITYVWAFEVATNDDYLISGDLRISLEAQGLTVDPGNTWGSPEIVLGDVGNGSPEPETFLPDANDVPDERRYIRFHLTQDEGGGWNSKYPTGSNIRVAYTSMPAGRVQFAECPMRMFLDGKNKMTNESSTGKVGVGGGISFDTNKSDPGVGFILKGSELSFPRQQKAPPGGFGRDTTDIRHRYAKVQVYFDKFLDFKAPTTLDKFITIETDPNTQVKTLKPAAITDADRLLLPGLSPEQMISRAAMFFGQPHLYHDGNKTKFIINKGKGGLFTVVNDIENFSPGPKKIPVLP